MSVDEADPQILERHRRIATLAGRGAIAVSMVAAVTTVWSALAALGFSICAAFLYLVASVQSDKISAWELKERLRLQQRALPRVVSALSKKRDS